ncbi:MAG: putative LPS assembly protein LptD [Lentisphaeria bacterium]
MRCGILSICALLYFCLAALVLADDLSQLFRADELHIEADELVHNVESGLVHARGHVLLTYGQLQLSADEASIDQNSFDYSASGEVKITVQGAGSWEAPALKGNLQQRTTSFGPFRLASAPWYAAGKSGELDEQGHKRIQGGWLSTCDCPVPHYRIEASQIVHNPDQSFTAKHVRLKFGSVPVFYLPWLWGSTNAEHAGILFKPGYSGKKGAYLQVGRICKNKSLGDSRLYMDLMAKRGLGLGYTGKLQSQQRDLDSQIYGIHDRKTPETSKGYNRRFKSVEDRYRLKTYYREQLGEGLSLRLNLDLLSDSDMLEDWFKRDYRRFEQAKSFADLSWDQQYFNLALSLRPRVNNFYTTVQQLPELRLSIPSTTLFEELPLLYNSENSLGYYSLKWRNNQRKRLEFIPIAEYIEQLHQDPHDYASFRADTLHTLSMPIDIQETLTLTPRASFRATAYSRSSRSRVDQKTLADMIAADNPDAPYNQFQVHSYDKNGGSTTRYASELGLEAKSKFYSDWMSLQMKSLDIDGLRHILQPYINYNYAPQPSRNREQLYFFDEIDRLQKQHFLRFGLDQRWQTRGESGLRDLISLRSYADWHFDRGEESGKYWGNLGNRLTLNLRKDLQTWAALVYDLGAGDVQRAEYGLRLGEKEKFNTRLSYIYRNQHLSRSVYSMGSSLADFSGENGYVKKHFESADIISADLHFPLSQISSFDVHAEYDLEDQRLAEHSYYYSRVLHCWTMMLGLGWEYNKFQAMIMFRLTAFPKVKIDLDI